MGTFETGINTGIFQISQRALGKITMITILYW